MLGSYGSAAIMAVPAHDARDFEFATQYSLPVARVVSVPGEEDDSIPFTGNIPVVNALVEALEGYSFSAKP